jgi:uncharacterized protein YcbX
MFIKKGKLSTGEKRYQGGTEVKVTEVWRYPVKSMLGEELDQAEVEPGGIQGDRQWAVVDAESGVSLSAKRYAELLSCRAWTINGEIVIALPDGSEFPVDSTEAANGLSALLGRNVITRSAESTQTIRHEFPTAITEGEGEPFLWEPGTEAFFDRAPLHLLTTATLSELRRLQPDSVFHRARFRPNFVIDTDDTGFVENEWVNRKLTLGSLKCQVIDRKPRCVMVTRSQGDLPKDIEVIRTILKNNDGNAGVELRALEPGTLRCGEEVVIGS